MKLVSVTVYVDHFAAICGHSRSGIVPAFKGDPLYRAIDSVQFVNLQGEQMMSDAEKAAQQALLDITVFYFDFDQSSIKESGKAALSAHAAYLASNSSARIVLEGHADERGTPEYNLALGERRAIAVRQFLMAKGASSSQVKVVSFGEEKPAVTGSTSSAYAKNRRVEVKYQSR